MTDLGRRALLAGLGAMAATPAAAFVRDADRVADMAEAGRRFLAVAPSTARFAVESGEATRWHWTNTRLFPRNGASLAAMGPQQRRAAMALLDASASAEGASRARQIMALQSLIRGDPLNFFVSVFGEPGDPLWGWRLEGHHLSLHHRVAGDAVSAAPFFLGARPNRGADGRRPLGAIQDAAHRFLLDMPPEVRRQAQVSTQIRGFMRHATGNAVRATPPPPEGVPVGALGAAGETAAQEIAAAYLASLPERAAARALERIGEAGWETVRFSWRGPAAVDERHYWRLQGPTFVLEWDDTRHGGDHIHSVWRDYTADFDPTAAL